MPTHDVPERVPIALHRRRFLQGSALLAGGAASIASPVRGLAAGVAPEHLDGWLALFQDATPASIAITRPSHSRPTSSRFSRRRSDASSRPTILDRVPTKPASTSSSIAHSRDQTRACSRSIRADWPRSTRRLARAVLPQPRQTIRTRFHQCGSWQARRHAGWILRSSARAHPRRQVRRPDLRRECRLCRLGSHRLSRHQAFMDSGRAGARYQGDAGAHFGSQVRREELASNPLPKVDVLVIGIGAAGGIASNVLAQAGIKVVAIEAGPRLSNKDFLANDDEISGSIRHWTGEPKYNKEIPTWRPDSKSPTATPPFPRFRWRTWSAEPASTTARKAGGSALTPSRSAARPSPIMAKTRFRQVRRSRTGH